MSNNPPSKTNIEIFVNRSRGVSIKETNDKGEYGIGDTIAISYDQIDEVVEALLVCKKEIENS